MASFPESSVSDLCTEMEKAQNDFLRALTTRERRIAVIHALNAVMDFVAPTECQVRPLLYVVDALARLNDGDVAPLLTADARVRRGVSVGGRARDGVIRSGLKGYSLGVVRAMTDCGDTLQNARRRVAATLNKAGIRTSRGNGMISERTLRNWSQTASENPKSVEARILGRFPRGGRPDNPREIIASLLSGLAVVAEHSRDDPVNPQS
jgi:hypothetical protein